MGGRQRARDEGAVPELGEQLVVPHDVRRQAGYLASPPGCGRGVASYPVEPGVDGVSSSAGLDRDLTGGPAGTVIRIGVQRHADGDSPGHEGQGNGGRQHRDVRPSARRGKSGPAWATGGGMATWAGAGRETAGALIALEASSMAVAKANGHT